MKFLRACVPFLGILAMAAMFLKMPMIFGCKVCSSGASYLPLSGAVYFATLTGVSLLFRGFPGKEVARGGLVWALTLGVAMTYLDFPKICTLCLIAHGCHILIWTIWLSVPAFVSEGPFSKKIFLLLAIPLSAAAVFVGANHIIKGGAEPEGLKIGDALPSFSARTIAGRPVTNHEAKAVFNFISSDCPYCKEQQEELKALLPALNSQTRFINITPSLPNDLSAYAHRIEWVEDPDQRMLELFHVLGFPTLFITQDGKIVHVVLGPSIKFSAAQSKPEEVDRNTQ